MKSTAITISVLCAIGPVAAAAPPTVTAGSAAPFSAPAGALRTLTVHVTQGSSPASPIASVTGNLSLFGGSAAEPFRDDGVFPDATANDGIYTCQSFLAREPGTYDIHVTATDSLETPRTGTGLIAVNFFALPTIDFDLGDLAAGAHSIDQPVTTTGTQVRWLKMTLPACPADGAAFVDIWCSPTIAATSSPATYPATEMIDPDLALYTSDGTLIVVDDQDGVGNGDPLWEPMISFGSISSRGKVTSLFVSDSVTRNGYDGPLAGGVYYLALGQYSMANSTNGFGAVSTDPNHVPASTVLHIETSDGLVSTNPSVTSTSVTNRSTGILSSGSTVLLTVTVAPGTNPTSTGTVVTGNTTAIGGAPGALFHDDGMNGDAYAFDGIYSYQTVVTSSGSVPITVTDSLARSASATIPVALTAVNNIGVIAGTDDNLATFDVLTYSFPHPFAGIVWIKFTLQSPATDNASAAVGPYLDIDTEGTGANQYVRGSPSDTMIALYRDNGTLIASNNDDGSYYRSLLTFGDRAPTRPGRGAPPNAGIPADGFNGNLSVGDYYLAVINANGSFGSGNFNVTVSPTSAAAAGTFVVNFLTNLPRPRCSPADLGTAGGHAGQDRRLDNNDFIAFVTAFFLNDPQADLGIRGGLPGRDGVLDNNDFIAFINEFFADQAACSG